MLILSVIIIIIVVIITALLFLFSSGQSEHICIDLCWEALSGIVASQLQHNPKSSPAPQPLAPSLNWSYSAPMAQIFMSFLEHLRYLWPQGLCTWAFHLLECLHRQLPYFHHVFTHTNYHQVRIPLAPIQNVQPAVSVHFIALLSP